MRTGFLYIYAKVCWSTNCKFPFSPLQLKLYRVPLIFVAYDYRVFVYVPCHPPLLSALQRALYLLLQSFWSP